MNKARPARVACLLAPSGRPSSAHEAGGEERRAALTSSHVCTRSLPGAGAGAGRDEAAVEWLAAAAAIDAATFQRKWGALPGTVSGNQRLC